jgi:hypothetical protein
MDLAATYEGTVVLGTFFPFPSVFVHGIPKC